MFNEVRSSWTCYKLCLVYRLQRGTQRKLRAMKIGGHVCADIVYTAIGRKKHHTTSSAQQKVTCVSRCKFSIYEFLQTIMRSVMARTLLSLCKSCLLNIHIKPSRSMTMRTWPEIQFIWMTWNICLSSVPMFWMPARMTILCSGLEAES